MFSTFPYIPFQNRPKTSRLNRVDWAPAERRDFLRAWNAMAKPTLLGKANEICLNSGSNDVETVSFLDVCWPSSEESKRMNRRGFSSLEVSGFQFTWAARYLCVRKPCDILQASVRLKMLRHKVCTPFISWFCKIGNFQLKSCCCLSLGVASNYFGYEDFQPHLFLIVAGSKFFLVFSLSKQGQPLRHAICACKSWPPKKR